MRKGGRPGKVLGIRADYDALNMTEDTGLPFAATNEALAYVETGRAKGKVVIQLK